RLLRQGAPALWARLQGTLGHDEAGAPLCRLTFSDISRRKLDAQNLAESEDLLRTVIANAGVGVAACDRELRCELFNDFLVRLTGVAAERVLGHHALDAFPELLRSGMQGLLHQVLEQGQVLQYQLPFDLPASGRRGGVLLTLSPRRDASGQISGVIALVNDLSERELAEQRFRQLFEHMSTGVALYRPVDGGQDFEFVDFNAAAERICQVPRAGVLGRRITEVFPGVAELGLLELLRAVARDGQARGLPAGAYQDPRLQLWVDNQVYRLPSGELVVLFDDITARMQAEQALHDSEQRYRLLAENMSDVVWLLGLDGRFRYVSPSVLQLRGYTADEVLQQSLQQVLTPESLLRTTTLMQRTLEGEEVPTLIEVEQPCKDGSTVWTEVSATLLRDARGQPEAVLGVSRDIRERKQLELALADNLRTLNEATRIACLGYWDRDLVSNEVSWSAEVFTMLGLPPQDQGLSLQSVLECTHPEDRARAGQAVQRALAGDERYDIDYRVLRPDQAIRWVHSEGDVERDSAGRPVRMRGIVQDITERKLAEQALLRERRHLRRLASQMVLVEERERRRITSLLHDQVGQNLAALKIALKQHQGQPSHAACVAHVERLLPLVEQSIAQTRHLTTDLSPPVLHQLGLAAALQWLVEQQQDTGCELRLHDEVGALTLPEELSITLFVAARELLHNAVKHAHASHITLGLRREAGELVLEVEDDGVGFDLGQVQHAGANPGFGLFSLAQRLDELAISLKLRSAPGAGCRVAVRAALATQTPPRTG
ncbi:MAG: PAS domain S-box protein, partial [Pseudomonadota bacterium]